MRAEFWVPGTPRPQGSKSYLGRAKSGKPRFKEASPDLKAWRTDVRDAAQGAGVHFYPKGEPVELELVFVMPRPNDHYLPANSRRLVRELRESAPEYHTSKPDGDKLIRAVKDALSAIAYEDDSQVAHHEVWKLYGERPGVLVVIRPVLKRAGRSQLDFIRGRYTSERIREEAREAVQPPLIEG